VPPRDIALGSWLCRVLVTTALIVLCVAPAAMAATRLVAPVGSNSGDCTVTPCASLGYA
jgi:hypothetical protein